MIVRFNKCLNLPARIYGSSIYAIGGAVVAFSLGTFVTNIVFGIVSGAIGFVLGGMFGKSCHAGSFQRWLYKKIPFAKYLVCSKIPSSHHRRYH